MTDLSSLQLSALLVIALGYYAMFRQLAKWRRSDLRRVVDVAREDQDAEIEAWRRRRESTRALSGRRVA